MSHLRAGRVLRFVRWTRLFAHVISALLILRLVFPRVARERRRALHGWWSRRLVRILGLEMRVDGPIPGAAETGAMIAANHVSWLDVFLVSSVKPTRFIAKSEVRDWPVAGWIAERAGTLFVRRARRRDTARINEIVKAALAEGDCVGLFPEGTTTLGDRLLKFHSSLFEPAVANAAHVHPLAIRYEHADGSICRAAAYDDLSFMQSLARAPSKHASLVFSAFPFRAANFEELPILQPHRGEGAAPHAAAVEREEVVANGEAERRPMPANHRVVAVSAAGDVEPGRPFVRGIPGLSLVAQDHRPAVVEHAQPRHRVDDDAQAIEAAKVVAPAVRLVAVHAREQLAVVRAAKRRLDLGRERARFRHRPLRHEGGVDQDLAVFDVHQRAMAQPRHQLVTIGRLEHVVERVAPLALLDAFGDAHEVKVVVAENGHRRIAQGLHEAQAAQGIGSAIDEIAHEPEAVAARIESDLGEEPLERLEAALQVADRVDRHRRRSYFTAASR